MGQNYKVMQYQHWRTEVFIASSLTISQGLIATKVKPLFSNAVEEETLSHSDGELETFSSMSKVETENVLVKTHLND